MNKLFVVLSTMATIFFVGCKDDESEPVFNDYLDAITDIAIDDVISTQSLDLKYPLLYAVDVAPEVASHRSFDIYYSTDNKNFDLAEGTLLQLKPFEKYNIKVVPSVVVNGNTLYGDTLRIEFYSIPKTLVKAEVSQGNGEVAAELKWNYYYYYDSPETDLHPLALNTTVNITTEDIPNAHKEIYSMDSNTNSFYVKSFDENGVAVYPDHTNVYWNNDGRHLLYWDAIKYDFSVNAKIAVGDKEVVLGDTIRSIFMDNEKCVCDNEFNLYRIKKFGTQTWTIDNYRGNHGKSMWGVYNYHSPVEKEWQSDGFKMYTGLYNGSAEASVSYCIKGYHIPSPSEWETLEKYLGIEYEEDNEPHDDLTWRSKEIDDTRNFVGIIESDDSEYIKYFSKKESHAFDKLCSDFGWKDENGNAIDTERLSMNSVPAGCDGYGFNAFPAGACLRNQMVLYGDGQISVFYIGWKLGEYRVISAKHNAIIHCSIWSIEYANVRLVKDEE